MAEDRAARVDQERIADRVYREVMASGTSVEPDDRTGRVRPPTEPAGRGESARDRRLVNDLVRRHGPLLTADGVVAVEALVLERMAGLGPLTSILADVQVTEIMVNGPGPVWVERSGRIEPSGIELDAATIELVVDRIVAPLGLRLDRAIPFLDGRLDDGSRVHIIVPPLAVDGPCITIRRFSPRPFGVEDFGPAAVAGVLRSAVLRRSNIIVSGGTGSGKTSLLNALVGLVPPAERIITMEDAAELNIARPHVVRLEARPPNAEGVGELTMRTLVRNALRMRPDRLIVGEVRGAEAFDLVQAMSTGHAGSMSTCHANSSADAIHRLAAMVAMSDARPGSSVVTAQLNAAIDLVIHVGRNGPRRAVDHVVVIDRERGPSLELVVGRERTTAGERWVLGA